MVEVNSHHGARVLRKNTRVILADRFERDFECEQYQPNTKGLV